MMVVDGSCFGYEIASFACIVSLLKTFAKNVHVNDLAQTGECHFAFEFIDSKLNLLQ